MTTTALLTQEPRQMSLFEPYLNERIRRKTHKGVVNFSLVDIMAEFSDLTSEGDVLWTRTEKRLKTDGFELDRRVIQLALTAKDGKKRKTACADGATCLRIIQSIPSEKAEPVRQWLASLGYERLEEYRNPGLGTQRAKERDLAMLKERGYSNNEALQHLQDRIDGMTGYKLLMATVNKACDKPQFGKIVNAEYVALFGEIADRLKELLNTTSIRDKLPALQLSYLRTAELTIQDVISGQTELTMADIYSIVEECVIPLGNHLRLISNMRGVHHVTGKLLTAHAQPADAPDAQAQEN